MNVKLSLEVSKLNEVAAILKAVAHPVRIQVIDILEQVEEASVTEIHETLGVEQSLISHHLIKMKDKGILVSRREGKSVLYSLRDKKMTEIIDCLEKCEL